MTIQRRSRTIPVALMLVAALVGGLAAQTAPQRAQEKGPSSGDAAPPAPSFKQVSRDWLADAGRIWSAPFRLKLRHVGPLIVVTAAAGFLIVADEDVRDAAQRFADRHAWVRDAGPVVSSLGTVGAAATAGLLFGAGLVFKDGRARDTGILAAEAMLQTFVVDNFVKGMTGRRRPSAGDGEDRWAGPSGFFKRYAPANKDLYDSFPSGHAATAFSVATVVALQYRHRPWIQVLAYTLAAGVGLSRVTEDRHWMSDVAVGAVIGHLIARLIVREYRQRRERRGLVPDLGCSGGSISIGFHYQLGPARP